MWKVNRAKVRSNWRVFLFIGKRRENRVVSERYKYGGDIQGTLFRNNEVPWGNLNPRV